MHNIKIYYNYNIINIAIIAILIYIEYLSLLKSKRC